MTFEERRDGHRIFLNSRADPTFWRDGDAARMLDELERHDTVGLEADPAYLAALARHATATGRTLAVSEFVTLTYAMCSAAHRRSFTSAVLAPRFELYGASEVGVLFMQGDGPLLEHCPETTHVELVPVLAETPGADAVAVVVVSTLDRAAQPLVRFVLGDLVCVAQGAQGAFTSVPPLASLEGRFQDAIVRPDGAWVTAGAVDRALAGLTSLATYQANQPDPKTVVVDVVAEAGAPASLCDDVVERLAALAGGMKVSARLVTAVPAEASGKFRLARRHFLVDLGALFAGGAGVAG
jgi:phenylacetate-CoA ligase